jgi:hypothetical protein
MLLRCSVSGALALICVVLAVVGAGGQEPKKGSAPPGDGASLAKILSDKALWGKDFPKALSSLPHWEAAGENKVEVFPTQVVSKPPAEGETHVELAAKVSAAMKKGQPKPKASYAELLNAAGLEPAGGLKAERIARFRDDQKPRIVMSAPGTQFLVPGLDLAKVESQLGPSPVKPVLRTIPTEGDRRPIVLTEYIYANGSVVFATSDVTPEPEGDPKKKPIDRAILDVPNLATEIFEGRP